MHAHPLVPLEAVEGPRRRKVRGGEEDRRGEGVPGGEEGDGGAPADLRQWRAHRVGRRPVLHDGAGHADPVPDSRRRRGAPTR